MNETLLLHNNTRRNLDRFLSFPAHAILLTGSVGSNKQLIARQLAASLLKVEYDRLVLQPYYYELVSNGSQSITIEQIRELQKVLTLKTTGDTSDIRRVLCIVNADTMTTEAQNAMLKSLEEPPADTVIILTAAQPENLLITIRSRSQEIPILPISNKDALEYFASSNLSEATITQYVAMSGGAAGLLSVLVSEVDDHELTEDIDQAKSILGLTAYERLCRIEEVTKQKEAPIRLLRALKRICSGALRVSIKKGHNEAARAWLSRLQYVVTAEESLLKNASAKLVLTDLFYSL